MLTDSNLAIALLIACFLIAVAMRMRATLAAAHHRATAAENLAASRGRCMALAARDLRGPGLALMSQAAKAWPEWDEPDDGRQFEAIAQQLLRLADDLAQSAAQSSPPALHEAPALLGPLIDAAVAGVAAQLRPAQRYWKIEPELRALQLRADSRALQGVLAALLQRAARHSRDGDMVALRHLLGRETVAIVVEDDGDGLAAQDLTTASASVPGPGTGSANGTRGLDLGLALARSLASAHGGEIRLESVPGIGAQAWLTLPRARLLEAA